MTEGKSRVRYFDMKVLSQIREYYLSPRGGQNSFYGKTKVLEVGDARYLESYDTIVAKIEDGKLTRLWSDWSATTGRHIDAFAQMFLGREFKKKDWDKLEVEE